MNAGPVMVEPLRLLPRLLPRANAACTRARSSWRGAAQLLALSRTSDELCVLGAARWVVGSHAALSRSRLTLLTVVAALTGALPACGTDDAIERDAKDAKPEIEKGIEDVDGK